MHRARGLERRGGTISATSRAKAGPARRVGAAAALLTLLASAQAAHASGYALREQSGSALGNAFAGATAGAEDLSYMFFNPAGLTRQEGSQVVTVGSLIVPRVKVRDAESSNRNGVPLGGNNGGSDIGEDALVPVFYAMLDGQQVLGIEENINFGLGVNVPFGLETDYLDGWVGRYHALHSKLLSINVNPAVAWEVVDGLSIAAGLQVQYVRARLTNAIDVGTIGQPLGLGGLPGQNDGQGKVTGDDVGFGYNLGVLYEPWQGTRFGAAYRSAISHDLRGDGDFSLDGSPTSNALQGAGLFRDTGVDSHVTTPETVSFGVYHQLSPAWAVMAEAQWTRWSRFDDLTIKFDNAAQPNSFTDEDWKDTWFLALGATWKPAEEWTLRGGVAWDQDPIPERRRTPRIPTDDRYWLSIGGGWQPLPNLMLDAGYTHLFFGDGSINLTASQAGNANRGNLSGRAEAQVDIFAVQAKWVF